MTRDWRFVAVAGVLPLVVLHAVLEALLRLFPQGPQAPRLRHLYDRYVTMTLVAVAAYSYVIYRRKNALP